MTTGRRILDHTLALRTRLGVRGPAALEELSGEALNDDTAQKLWEVSERLTHVQRA